MDAQTLGLLGRLAVQMGMISPEQLAAALTLQAGEDEPRQLGRILLEQGAIEPSQLQRLVDAQDEWRDLLSAAPRRARSRLAGVAASLAHAEAAQGADPELLDMLFRAWDAFASDLHVGAGVRPWVRVDGELVPLDRPPPSAERVATMLRSFLSDDQWTELQEHGDVDLAWQPHEAVRCRVNAFVSRGGAGVAFRLVSTSPPSLQELNLPSVLARCVGFHQGLVVVTGPSGCGKSSTLAALIRLVNEERPDNIITIEDPIEFVHGSAQSSVLQRQVGRDTESFASALRGALRQDPDVLLVGELRDLETVQLAISAAETGHLVLATMHTLGAAGTIDRLIGTFPATQQPQIRAMLSESLRAVVSQRLLRRTDAAGRVPACEIVFNNPSIANLIRDGRTFQLANVIALSRGVGMCRMEDSVRELIQAGVVGAEELHRAAH